MISIPCKREAAILRVQGTGDDESLFLELGNLGLDSLHLLLSGQLAALVLEPLLLPLLLGLLLTSLVNLLERVFANLLVSLLVQLLQSISLDLVIDVALELGLVSLLVVVGKGLHVLGDVATEDILAKGVGVKFLRLDIETREAVLGVGDQNATIGSTFHGTEDTSTSGSAGKTNIEVSLERSAWLVALSGLSKLVLSISLLHTLEVLVQVKLLENTAGDQETGAVCGRPVGKTVFDAIGLKLVGVRSAEDLVASDLGGHDLHDDVAVGEADDEAVLGRIVLVLGLCDEALACVVVGLSNTTALVLGLVATGDI